MGKVLKVAAVVAAVAVAFVPGVGTALSSAIATSGLFGAAGGVATFASLGAASSIIGGIATLGVMSAMGIATKALGLGPKPPRSTIGNTDRLRAALDPRAFRKVVFGRTASAVDVRYQEFSGSKQEYLDSVICLASHKLQEIEEIWFDSDKAWSASGGVTSKFSGYLTVTTRAEGTSGNAVTIGGGTSWTAASARLTGCAYIILKYKLTGNSKKAESPFGSNVTSRITVRVRGALMYDPRRDSTAGGSGTQRADDQSTWSWVDDDTGRNPALQLLWYMLGWKINGKLAVGRGIPAARIDLASFITAANICDEVVSLSGGGTEKRYRSDGVLSEGDDPSVVFDNLLAACNGVMRDAGGKIRLDILTNDLATPVYDFTEADVVGAFNWIQSPPISETFNVVRGRYTNASDASLYQMSDYPEIALASPDGIERASSFDLAFVQSATQAQRIAKTYLQRAQFPGTFSADFLASGWRVQVGSVIRLTFPALGFSNKLFRVIEHTIRLDGIVPMVLREENAAIYAWSTGDETAAVVPASPISYNPLNEPLVQGVGDADLTTWQPVMTWEFRSSLDGWGTTNITATQNADSVSLAATTADPNFTRTGLSINGGLASKVRVRLRRTAGSGWDGKLYYGTAGHGYSESYHKRIDTDPTTNVGEWVVVEWDMEALTAGGTDWVSSTITSLRFDLGAATGSNFEIDWISIGKTGPVTIGGLGYTGDLNATNGAPTGTSVGGTAAATVAAGANAANNGVNSDGTIKTDRVDTPAILANAVTAQAYASTAGSVSSSPGSSGAIQSVTATVGAGLVQIAVSFNYSVTSGGSAAAAATVALRRDGTVIANLGGVGGTTGIADMRSFNWIDQPGAGSHTYDIYVTGAGSPSSSISYTNRLLALTEAKR